MGNQLATMLPTRILIKRSKANKTTDNQARDRGLYFCVAPTARYMDLAQSFVIRCARHIRIATLR